MKTGMCIDKLLPERMILLQSSNATFQIIILKNMAKIIKISISYFRSREMVTITKLKNHRQNTLYREMSVYGAFTNM